MKYFAQIDAFGLIIAVCFGSLVGEDLVEINKDQYDIVRAGGSYSLNDGVLIKQETPVYSPSLAEELAALTAAYKVDSQELQLIWLSAIVSDGASEASKKSAIRVDMEDLRQRYVADLSAAKARHTSF